MNQEKIGKFISELRKEKKMTQLELANKIGVTDRAISKWENGRGMPDLSLIKPLCETLDISINELLSGERIEKKEYQEKLEENILKTIDYTDKKIKKTKKTYKTILTIILIIISTLIIMFSIDINMMRNNKPVIFSTWGYDYAPPIDFKEEEIMQVIEDYLVNRNDSESNHHNNEKWFISFRPYLIEEKNNNILYNIYAWVLEESYYFENNEIKKDSGSSIPYKFVVQQEKDKYIVTETTIPRDGSLYLEDMKKIFPSSVRKDMDKVYKDGTIERLQLEINRQVKLYFHE